jgi:predicted phosphodiesterase
LSERAVKVIVIGDAHVDEDQSLARFKALGKYIKDTPHDVVVSIGDFMSMNCLSDWDRNKRMKMEGKRYAKEVSAGNVALDHFAPSCKKLVYVKGNHENRLDRYFEVDPTFQGINSLEKDLMFKERGIVPVEYKSNYDINGVSFTHIPINGVGKPISNPNVCKKALSLYHNSVVFGHTHTLDHCAEHRQNAPHLNQALAVGCFFEHVDDYAKGSKTDYWRGIVTLNIYHRNRFDYSTLSLSNLRKKYG